MIKKLRKKYQARKLEKVRGIEQPSAFDNGIISWTAPEYIRHERGPLWKAIAFLSLIAAAILGYIYNAWTFSLAIVVFAVVYYLIQLEHPRNVEVIVSDIGVKVGNRKYPFTRIKAFWIVYEPPYVQTLNIRVDKDLACDITILMNYNDPALLREFLLSKIPEMEGQGESLSDALLRLFKI